MASGVRGVARTVNQNDWRGCAEIFGPNFRQISHQSGLSFEVVGRDEYLASVRSIYDRECDGMFDVLTARGRWSIVLYHVFGSGDDEIGPWEVARVAVGEMDDDGLWLRSEVYDETEIERARARLDEVAAASAD